LDVLKSGKMPVLYGDMVVDSQWGFSVCSGDQIIVKFAKEAEFTVWGTDVDGILVEGEVIGKIDNTNFSEISWYLQESGSPDVTGGMYGKVLEMLEAGGTYFVVNANYAQRIEAVLHGESAICTKLEFL